MNCWEVLELEPTKDARAIKKAYTRLLRKFPPEADSQGFQDLREAYEQALVISRLQFTNAPQDGFDPGEAPGETDRGASPEDAGVPAASGNDPGPVGEPIPMSPELLRTIGFMLAPQPGQDLAADDLRAVDELLAKIEKDYPDKDLRQTEAYWRTVTESELLWNLSAKAYLGYRLFQFLGARNLEFRDKYYEAYLPGTSWKSMDDAFGWLENEGQLYARLPDDLCNAVLDRIREARGLATSLDLVQAYQPTREQLNPESPDYSDPSGRIDWSGTMGTIARGAPLVLFVLAMLKNCSS